MTRGNMISIGLIFHNNHGTITSAANKQQKERMIGEGVGLPSGDHNQRMKDAVPLLWMIDTQ